MTDSDTDPTFTDGPTRGALTDLAPGFDANKADHSTDLAGRTITVLDTRGGRISYEFAAHTLRRDRSSSLSDGAPATVSVDPYEAFLVDTGLYLVQFRSGEDPDAAVSLVLDLTNGRALSIVQHIERDDRGNATVAQHFDPMLVEGKAATGLDPAPTTELIGRRVLWIYSARHAYEHVYLSPLWYTWHCLAGPEHGLADTDRNTTWTVRPGIYVFTWQEKVVPCGAVTVADHRRGRALRSHGVLFGLDETGMQRTHLTFGAHGRLLSVTAHPEPYDPADRDPTVTPA